jgi:CRP-like cAMP-binding protein
MTLNKGNQLHQSIVSQIIDGSIVIESIDEFKSMLKIFPDHPDLHRAFAERLARRKSFAAACQYFDQASSLYAASGRPLPAIVTKMLQWQITKPSYGQLKTFFLGLLENNDRNSPLKLFLAGLSFHELVALITRMERIVMPPGKVIKKFGDVENNLYLVVSGDLRTRILKPTDANPDPSPALERRETEFFGDIFPLSRERYSQSVTETLSRVELVRISRAHLLDLIVKYPSLERGLQALATSRETLGVNGRSLRRTKRHEIPVRVKLEIGGAAAGQAPLISHGSAKDLSISGMCVILDERLPSAPAPDRVEYSDVRVWMSLPDDHLSLNVKGQIVWSRPLVTAGTERHALGIKFQSLPPNLSGLLLVFADNLLKD